MDIMELKHGAKFKGRFDIEIRDKEGNLLSSSFAENILTNEGLNHILNVIFNEKTQIHPFYCGIFTSDSTPGGTETYDVPVFTEWTGYTPTTRPTFDEVTTATKTITNTVSKAVFTSTSTADLYGAALFCGTEANVKGDHAAGATKVLLCAGRFAAPPQPVISGNVVNLTYTITAADAG